MNEKGKGRGIKRLFGLVLIFLLVGLLIFSIFFALTMFASVGVGHAAIIVNPWAKTVSEPLLGPCWIVKAPWERVVDIYYATDTYEDTIPCFSSDQLEMAITVQMRWKLNTSRLNSLYKSYPRLDYEATAIDSIMEETLRLVTKRYNALETIEFRQIVAEEMQTNVFQKIAEEPSLEGALSYLRFDLKNIAYPADYTKAIEDKLVKEQMKLGAEFEKERIMILANATAQEILIKSEAEAQAKIIIANSTRQGIELILTAVGGDPTNATRIAELYLWVETLKTIAPYIDTILLAGQQVPFLISIPTNSTG